MTIDIYPIFKRNSPTPLYYVEFDRDGEGTFTLFRRNFITNKYEWKEEESFSLHSSEVHPFNLFTGQYGKGLNAIPNREWVAWMVDKLNN